MQKVIYLIEKIKKYRKCPALPESALLRGPHDVRSLKIISVGIPTYASVKIGSRTNVSP